MPERFGKGRPVEHYIADYVLLDLETTSTFINAAKIIEISAIKVINNQAAATFSTLINPQRHIPASATQVNHITGF